METAFTIAKTRMPGASSSSSAALRVTRAMRGVPLASSEMNSGLDALYSIVQMPPGMPVATVAIGSWGARNAATLAAEILSLSHDDIRAKYDEYRANLGR